MKHRYLVRVESMNEQAGDTASESSIQFEVSNHDDIFAIIKKLENREEFAGDDAKAFGVGLKLFSEVMLKKRDYPLFSQFLPHFIDFMKELKTKAPGS